jgi:nucleoside-diphosphate-sugar epimerase
MTKIAITGATGFVGGALARRLAAAGHQLVALARSTSNREALADLPIQWHLGDVTDPASLEGFADGADWLIHAAGRLGEAGVPESAYQELHVEGTRNLLTAVALSSPTRILYVSSPGVLGPIEGEPANEAAPLAPSNIYERSKAAAEQVAQQFIARGLPIVIARPEFIYGPGDLHVLGLFQAVANGRFFTINNGRAYCHPTYIEDAVNGMILALEKGRPGEIYHIAGPEPVTFRQLGETIAAALNAPPPKLSLPQPVAWLGATTLELMGKLAGKRPPLSRDGVAFFSENRRFSWDKAARELGYAPQFDLEKGVQATVGWYREHNYLT